MPSMRMEVGLAMAVLETCANFCFDLNDIASQSCQAVTVSYTVQQLLQCTLIID